MTIISVKKNNKELLKSVPIFNELDDKSLEYISSLGFTKKVLRNEVIYVENEKGSTLGIIIKGKLRISRVDRRGKEVILTILDELDFFGEMSILDGSPRSANVSALTDSELFIIERNDFIKLLNIHPEISISLLIELTGRLRDAELKIKSLLKHDAEGRVGTVLLQLADKMGKIKNGIVEIDKLPFQNDIARMANTSRETISRILHVFVKKGLIELKGSGIKILEYENFKQIFKGKIQKQFL